MALVHTLYKLVQLRVACGAGSNGTDYMATSADYIFLSGSSSGDMKCLDINVLNDSALERYEVFTVTLTTDDSNVLIETANTTTITIIDDDS